MSGKWERDPESGHFLVIVLVVMALVGVIALLAGSLIWWVLLCIEPILAGIAIFLFLGWRGYKK